MLRIFETNDFPLKIFEPHVTHFLYITLGSSQ